MTGKKICEGCGKYEDECICPDRIGKADKTQDELLLTEEQIGQKLGKEWDGLDQVSLADYVQRFILAKAKPIIIREEQKRNAGALRVLFEKGWTLNDLIQAEDTMGEAYTSIVEEAKKQERERIIGIISGDLGIPMDFCQGILERSIMAEWWQALQSGK